MNWESKRRLAYLWLWYVSTIVLRIKFFIDVLYKGKIKKKMPKKEMPGGLKMFSLTLRKGEYARFLELKDER